MLLVLFCLQIFRLVMYPNYGSTGGGLLRLHSTYRHDFKIYSSDEGRVQVRGWGRGRGERSVFLGGGGGGGGRGEWHCTTGLLYYKATAAHK